MSLFRLYILCYIIAIAFVYLAKHQTGAKWVLPGDINIEKEGMKFYIPTGSGLIFATLLFIILKSFMS